MKSIVQIRDREFWLRCDEEGKPLDGEVKSMDVLVKEIPRTGFAITYLSNIVQMIDAIGNKKLQVVKYILTHMDSNNKLNETVREIAANCNVSKNVVNETLKLLESVGVVARKTGLVMLSPKLVHKGNAQRERYLLTKFQEIKTTEDGGADVNPEQTEN